MRNRFICRLVALCFAATLTLGAPPALNACSCMRPGPPCRAFWSADIVLVGKVVAKSSEDEIVPRGDGLENVVIHGGTNVVHFQVIEALRGISSTEIDVRTASTEAACGYHFEESRTYLVYAWERNGQVTTGRCSRTELAEKAQPDLEYIRSLPQAPPWGVIHGHVDRVRRSNNPSGPGESSPMANTPVIATGEHTFTTATDALGNFTISQVPSDEYTVRLKVPSYLSDEARKVYVPKSGCAEEYFQTHSTSRIEGRVMDSAGKPVKGIVIEAIPWAVRHENYPKNLPVYAHTDQNGNYRTEFLDPGEYVLVANLQPTIPRETAYPPQFYPSESSSDSALKIRVGDGTVLSHFDFRLPAPLRWLSIPVATVWADGAPAAGSEIRYAPKNMGYLFLGAPNTGPNGEALVSMLDDTDYLICARNQNLFSRAMIVKGKEGKSVRLVLASPAERGECPDYRRLATQ